MRLSGAYERQADSYLDRPIFGRIEGQVHAIIFPAISRFPAILDRAFVPCSKTSGGPAEPRGKIEPVRSGIPAALESTSAVHTIGRDEGRSAADNLLSLIAASNHDRTSIEQQSGST